MNLGAAITCGAAMMWTGAALAGPAEDLAGFLDSLGPDVGYAQVVAAEDGGVTIERLAVSPAMVLQAAGMPPAEDGQAEGAALLVESLRLNEGAAAMLVGTNSGAEPGPISVSAEGVRLDLAALAGSASVEQFRGYLGADALAGGFALTITEPGNGSFQVEFDLDLDALGVIGLRLEVDEEGVQLPSGTLRLTDSPTRGIAGFGAWIRRGWLESALVMMELYPIDDYDVRAQEAEEKLREAIAASASTGPEAAAALAAWAREMAAALPEHAGTLQALAAFGEGPGRLDITIAPPDRDAELMFNMFAGPDPIPTPEQVATTIETMGLSAAFAAE